MDGRIRSVLRDDEQGIGVRRRVDGRTGWNCPPVDEISSIVAWRLLGVLRGQSDGHFVVEYCVGGFSLSRHGRRRPCENLAADSDSSSIVDESETSLDANLP